MKLATLNHVSSFTGKGPAVAAQEAVAMGRYLEKIGYHRYWISENHGPASGCGSPEILVAAAAGATDAIRVGTAAVLLPYYAPWKVATSFNLLSRLFGDRIDLGIGRGPGAAPETRELLKPVSEDPYDSQIATLVDTIEQGGTGPLLPPAPMPQMWLMSFSENGALTAARHGMAFCFGQFAHDKVLPDVFKLYRDNFQPRSPGDEPCASVCVTVACADDPDDVVALETLIGHITAPSKAAPQLHPQAQALPSWQGIRELEPMSSRSTYRTLSGSPPKVGQLLNDIVDAYQPDEIAVATACPDFDLRVRTFEIIAQLLDDGAG